MVSAGELQAALDRSQATGLPLLVLGTSESCAPCHYLRHRLDTEPALKQLLTQYVRVDLKVSDAQYREWTKRFAPAGRGVPMIFIVSAKGKEIHNASGAPRGRKLNRLLASGIELTGGYKQIKPAAATIAAKPDKKVARVAEKPDEKPAKQ